MNQPSQLIAYLEIFKSKSFLKLFFSLLLFVILPFSIFISNFLYNNYKDTLDWNYRFQLTRVQLMAIDMENHIRDQLSTQTKENKHFWVGSIEDFLSKRNFVNCIEDEFRYSTSRKTFLFACEYENVNKNWVILYDGKLVWIYTAEFLEDLLLDSPFSEPNESVFLINQIGNFGLSSQIESDFRIPARWLKILSINATEDLVLPKIRDVEIDEESYFLSSISMYGLPFNLYVISSKESMLIPVKENMIRNVIFLSLLFLFSISFSAIISGREMEDKRKLNIVFREFPHAALLFDAYGNELLINPYLESNLSIKSLSIDGQSVHDRILKESKSFLNQAGDWFKDNIKSFSEEWETKTKAGDIIILEVAFHLWFLENNHLTPRGTLVLIQDITDKKLEFEKEMVYAKILQKKYLPQTVFDIPALSYDFLYLPLLHVGGDYYDFIKLESNRYIFVLGDIIGHGIQAAMMMTVVRVMFHQIVKETQDPAHILEKLNTGVFENLPETQAFVPIHFIYFDFRLNKIYYGNAGHPGIIQIKKDGTTRSIERLNPILGLLPTFEANILELDIEVGDRFFLFTDGLPDIRDKKGDDLGVEAVTKFFQSSAPIPISDIKENLIHLIREHTQGASHLDDITWMGIEIV